MVYSAAMRPCVRVLALSCGLLLVGPPRVSWASSPTEADTQAPAPAKATSPEVESGDELAAETTTPATTGTTPRPRRGLGLLIGGVPLGVIGLITLGFGGAFLYEDLPSVCDSPPCGPGSRGLSVFGASIFATGLVVFASGAAMTAVGAVRHHRYRKWRATQTARGWTPGLARSGHGTWLVGLRLRF